MNMMSPFKVRITDGENLELILTNRRSKTSCAHSHPMNRNATGEFANTLEAALASGAYAGLGCCPSRQTVHAPGPAAPAP